MKISSKIILIIASFHSFNTCMEIQKPQLIPLNGIQQAQVAYFCKQAHTALKNIEHIEQHETSFKALLTLITETRNLTSYNITLEELGSFSYHKQASFPEDFPLLKSPNHYHIALLFAKLIQFHDTTKNKTLFLPQRIQYETYVRNKKIKENFIKAIEQAQAFRFIITKEEIRLDQRPFMPLPEEKEIKDIDELVEDLQKIYAAPTVEIKSFAELLYVNNTALLKQKQEIQ